MRILVVDDDPLILQTLQAFLDLEGHSVTTRGGGRAGIDAFNLAEAVRDPFGLVITDASMPHVDGRRVVKAVKETSPSTPVILFTGSAPQYPNDESLQADFVLMKPANMKELRAVVRVAAVRSNARSAIPPLATP
jgi:DNA-binding response OmpR family regulator